MLASVLLVPFAPETLGESLAASAGQLCKAGEGPLSHGRKRGGRQRPARCGHWGLGQAVRGRPEQSAFLTLPRWLQKRQTPRRFKRLDVPELAGAILNPRGP